MCQVFILTVDDVIKFKIFLESASEAMNDKKKDGKTETQKFEYLENEKSFLNEIKTFFIVFEAPSFGKK